MRNCLYIPFGSYLYLLNLLELHTAYKQAVCVSVLQMCCNFGNKQRQANTHSTSAKVVQTERNTKINHINFLFPSVAYLIKR